MAHRTDKQPVDIAAVNAELERLMAEEDALKLQVAEMIKRLEDKPL